MAQLGTEVGAVSAASNIAYCASRERFSPGVTECKSHAARRQNVLGLPQPGRSGLAFPHRNPASPSLNVPPPLALIEKVYQSGQTPPGPPPAHPRACSVSFLR